MKQKLFADPGRFRQFLLETVYPEQAVCRACGAIVREGCLCDSCREELRRDGAAFSWSRQEVVNGVQAYSLRAHRGIARQLVIRLKHEAEACVAEELAALVWPLPAFLTIPAETVVTWVTMPERRRRERCIDHGYCLADAVARELGLVCRPLLARADSRGKTQARLNKVNRVQNLIGVFSPLESIRVPVLLVDDVLTTGTTASRCVEALREGGAREITVLTITAAGANKGFF